MYECVNENCGGIKTRQQDEDWPRKKKGRKGGGIKEKVVREGSRGVPESGEKKERPSWMKLSWARGKGKEQEAGGWMGLL